MTSNSHGRNFLVAYNKKALDKHPNILGLRAKRGTNNDLVRIGNFAKLISKGDKIIFYLIDDASLKGIFKVTSERIKRENPLFATEWSDDVQFTIESDSDSVQTTLLKPLIPKMHLFEHLENPLKDYRMAIGGVNYVREISDEDLQIIADSLGLELKIKESDHK